MQYIATYMITFSFTASHKKTEIVRRKSLSEYNKTIRNEYTASPAEKEDESEMKSSNPCMPYHIVHHGVGFLRLKHK